MATSAWPEGLDPNTICFSLDVEWAPQAVIDDTRALFDEYGVKATFFVTHAGVMVPGHERGIHPNFFRSGDTYKALAGAGTLTDAQIHEHVIATTLSYAPEARGVRAHSLHYDSALLPIYRRLGIEYECSYRMPFVAGLRPFWTQRDIVAIPSYYSDFFDLLTGASRFELERLDLGNAGIKVCDFHPVVVFTNVPSEAEYTARKGIYHDPERLLASRHVGKGVRTLLRDLLEHIALRRIPTMTLGELNALWRTVPAWP
jgi:hypothetical protein